MTLSRLGLGTVQFGMNYGISNRGGRPSESEVPAILERAEDYGVVVLDTAYAYPNAEVLIGRHRPRSSSFKIVTKTPPVDDDHVDERHGKQLLDALASSL